MTAIVGVIHGSVRAGSWTRTAIAAVLIAAGWLAGSPVTSMGQTSPAPGSPARATPAPDESPAPTRAAELHKLGNDELLKQAQDLYARAHNDYRSLRREIAAIELLLKRDQQRLDAPASTSTRPAASPIDPASPDLEQARAKQVAALQRQTLLQEHKAHLDSLVRALEASQTASTTLLAALDALSSYTVELDLRVKDGTLPADQFPAALTAESIEETRDEVTADQARRQKQASGLQASEADLTRRVDESNRAVLVAEAELAQASKAFAQQQKRQEFEKTFEERDPERLIEDLTQMVEESPGLKGTYDLALRRFQTGAAELDRLDQEWEALAPPAARPAAGSSGGRIGQSESAATDLLAFHQRRSQLIEERQRACRSIQLLGADLQTDAAVYGEHLLEMQVMADALRATGQKVPAGAEPESLAGLTRVLGESTATAQGQVEAAKKQLADLDKQLADAQANTKATATRLAAVKKSRELAAAAIEWETELKGKSGPEAIALFTQTEASLKDALTGLAAGRKAFEAATAEVAAIETRRQAMKDPMLRAAEHDGSSEKEKIRAQLRKDAGIDRLTPTAAVAPKASISPPGAGPEPASDAAGDAASAKPAETGKDAAPSTDRIDAAIRGLQEFQQTVAARVNVINQRDEAKRGLLAAVTAAESRAQEYAGALTQTRDLTLRLFATAIDLKKRLGRGELPGDQIPEGVSQALRREPIDTLESDGAAVLAALEGLQARRESLSAVEATYETTKTLTKEVLALIGRRLDLLDDLKGLDAGYKRERSARSPTQVKLDEQKAAEWRERDAASWDFLLNVVASDRMKNLSDILDSHYGELVDLVGKESNLQKQRETLASLIELTTRESATLGTLLTNLNAEITRRVDDGERESLLARAQLNPEQADELIRNYQAKTGRLLSEPVPVPEKDRPARVEELSTALFNQQLQVLALERWRALLETRRGENGLEAELARYEDEQGELKATSDANSRHVQTLTGSPLPEPPSLPADAPASATTTETTGAETPAPAGAVASPATGGPGTRAAVATAAALEAPVTGGEIQRTRLNLRNLRITGLQNAALKIGGILAAAFLLPPMLSWLFTRRYRAGEHHEHERANLAVTAMKAFWKTAIWVAALVAILSTLGFDVSAIIAGLGIGGLAIGLAAQPMISDIIGALIIFAERRFQIGDVVRIGTDEPAQVVGLTWRSTQFKSADGVTVNIPNRNVTSANLQNLTREGKTYDSINVTVTTAKDVDLVRDVIRSAMSECEHLTEDRGESVKEFTHKDQNRVIKYRFWWYLRDYAMRNRTRDEVFTKISQGLAAEHLAGTEITLA